MRRRHTPRLHRCIYNIIIIMCVCETSFLSDFFYSEYVFFLFHIYIPIWYYIPILMRRALLANGGDRVVFNTAHYIDGIPCDRRWSVETDEIRESSGTVCRTAIPDLHYYIRVEYIMNPLHRTFVNRMMYFCVRIIT